MGAYMPYIVSVICAVIAGFASYAVARKQVKADIEKIIKQHELDIEKEREKFAMEKEKIELEYKHQLTLKEKEFESQLGTTLMSEVMKMPEIRQQLAQGIRGSKKEKQQVIKAGIDESDSKFPPITII